MADDLFEFFTEVTKSQHIFSAWGVSELSGGRCPFGIFRSERSGSLERVGHRFRSQVLLASFSLASLKSPFDGAALAGIPIKGTVKPSRMAVA